MKNVCSLLTEWWDEWHLYPCCRTPLMLGVSAGHSDCVVILLKYGADTNLVDEDQHPALFRAVSESWHDDITQIRLVCW